MKFPGFRRASYDQLNSEHGDDEEDLKQLSAKDNAASQNGGRRNLLTIVICLTVGAIVGFFVGSLHGLVVRRTNALGTVTSQVPLRQIRQSFQYNTSFAKPPPKQGGAEPMWDSMIPNGLGYVNGTVLAPEISMISTFHQLHCLYTLRRAYYSRSEKLEDFDLGKERSAHVAHCFDYIRQSLLCAADSSLEPADKSVKMFLGSGFARRCRDFQQLKNWAEDRRAFDAHGFLAVTDHGVLV